MMTKKDCELIAEMLSATSCLYESYNNYVVAVNMFATRLSHNNPEFNTDTFKKAAGVKP